MSRKIFKYPVPIEEETTLRIHRGAEVLSAQVQGRSLCLWCLVDPLADVETRTFRTYGTGQELPEGLGSHVVTYQLDGFVWHVFEV